MKITVYNSKGGAGKTPISANIVLDREYAVGVNETEHVYDDFGDTIPDDTILPVELTEPFTTVRDGVDIVFDLSGAISETAQSITSALVQSDLVIIPIEDEYKSIKKGKETLREINSLSNFKGKILVVATKLKKAKKEGFKPDGWQESRAFKNIQAQLAEGGYIVPMLPLKHSEVYNTIFEKEMSISQLRASDALANHSFKIPDQQFQLIYDVIDQIEREGGNHAEQEQRSTA